MLGLRFKQYRNMRSKACRAVKPSETVKLTVPLDQLKKLKGGTTEIVVEPVSVKKGGE